MPEKIAGQVAISQKTFSQLAEKVKNISGFAQAVKETLSGEVTQILEVILAGAIKLDSSDIHIEREKEKAKMRVRIDGILHDVLYLELKIYQGLLSRIKLLSGIKLNIADQAQDGRFTILLEKVPIEVRASTLPSEYGETIVMRVLNPKSLIEIEDLGVREDVLEVFKKEIQRPNGMIMVTGPTGSGKTTTLYAVLKRIQHPEIKIITIEDPIEYHLEGISQTQVNPKKGYDFATGLRAIVRQDPDVILVGEIRDFETAKIALQAALTGHLVLSTLHTNDAAGTVTRLQALGEKPVNIAPAITLAIAQRLVRKVCKKCARFESPGKLEESIIKKELKSLPKKIKIPSLNNLKIPKSKGCQSCNATGYRGRIGIFEFFLVDPELENFILKSPSISALRKMAEKKGMVSMRKDGLIKVIQGITTIEEVNRVAGR